MENLDDMADDPVSPPGKSKSSIKRIRIGLNVLMQIAFAVAIVSVVNWLSCQKYAQWDRSASKRYSLGPQTTQVLENLSEDLYLTMAFGRGSDIYPYTQRIIDLYEQEAHGRLKVRWVDPLRDPAAIAELRNQDPKLIFEQNKILISKSEKLNGTNADGKEVSSYEMVTEKEMFQRGETVAFRSGSPRPGKILQYRLESALTSALVAATEEKNEVAYIVASKGFPQGVKNPSTGKIIDAGMIIRDKAAMRQNLLVKPLSITPNTTIPEDASVVILLAPTVDFTGAELKQLFRDYWEERKGGIILMIDPLQHRALPNLLGYLDENYGVRFENDRILAMRARGGRTIKVSEVECVYMPGSPITEPLFGRATTLPGQSSSININISGGADSTIAPKAADKKPLIIAYNDFWKEKDYRNLNPVADPRETMDVNVAVSVERGAGINQDLRLNSSRMVLIGNGSFMDLTPTQESEEFMFNSINWTTDREELVVGIGAHAAGDFRVEVGERPFKKLELMSLRYVPGLAFLIGLIVAFFRRR